LGLPADSVPIMYRVTVLADGVDSVGESTHMCLPGDVAAATERVRAAMIAAGFGDPKVVFTPM
jgi:hypothetical protein